MPEVLVLSAALAAPALLTTTPAWTVWYAWQWLGWGAIAAAAARWPARAARVLRLIGPVLAALALSQRLTGARVTWPYNENATASALLLLIPWHWGQNWPMTGLLLAGLIATGSSGAALAFVCAVALLITHNYGRDVRRPGWAYALIAVGLAIIAGVVIAVLQPATTAARFDHWDAARELWIARPVVGWGPGSFLDRSPIPDQNHADNLLLTIGAEMGALGVVALLLVVGVIVRQVMQTTGNPARMAVLSWLLHNLIDCTLFFPLVGAFLAANVSLLWRQDVNNPGSGTSEPVGSVGTLPGCAGGGK